MIDSELNEYENRRKWHLDKRLNVGHILTTIALTFTVLVWAAKMDNRITVLEVQQLNLTTTGNEIKGQLQELNRKLDRLIENGK